MYILYEEDIDTSLSLLSFMCWLDNLRNTVVRCLYDVI